tara:strand:+ start:193 stop:1494 length:1302 start_codon:yes stop_codon:yes gene_type:complete
VTHFAVIAPPLPSHYRVLQALAVELVERGHRVTFIHQVEAGNWLTDARIGFCAVGAKSHPTGSLSKTLQRAARPGGPWGLHRLIVNMSRDTEMLCQEVPVKLRELQVDALLCDQMEAAGGLIGEAVGLPYISIACALPVNREPGIPLPVMPMDFETGERAEKIYAGSTQVYDWMMTPHRRTIARLAEHFGLSPREGLHECLSPYAQISQTITGFDFPRKALPPHFHAVGPLRHPSHVEPELDLPVDDKRPLVFASLGTLLGQRFGLFRRIVHACRDRNVQLLLAHCGGLDARQADRLRQEGATWVTDFAPQRAALARADAVISHGGLNTVLDALAARTPVLALPLAFDHPGAAARVVHAGVGLRASPRFASYRQISAKLNRLLEEPGFRTRLEPLGAEVEAAGGTPMAADIIERVAGIDRSKQEHAPWAASTI